MESGIKKKKYLKIDSNHILLHVPQLKHGPRSAAVRN